MEIIEVHQGVFLRILLTDKLQQSRYRQAYQDACYSGKQVAQTTVDSNRDGSLAIGLWLDARLVDPLKAAIVTDTRLKDIVGGPSPSTPRPGVVDQ